MTYDPSKVSFRGLLDAFMEGHNPTQANGQGNDTGSQYRGGIYTHTPEQKQEAEEYLKQAQSNFKVLLYYELSLSGTNHTSNIVMKEFACFFIALC